MGATFKMHDCCRAASAVRNQINQICREHPDPWDAAHVVAFRAQLSQYCVIRNSFSLAIRVYD